MDFCVPQMKNHIGLEGHEGKLSDDRIISFAVNCSFNAKFLSCCCCFWICEGKKRGRHRINDSSSLSSKTKDEGNFYFVEN